MKVEYNGTIFDSQLEVDYYKYLKELKQKDNDISLIVYHPKVPIQITAKNTYTPDFIVCYSDRVEIIETKGYNQFSYARDAIIHSAMLAMSEEQLRKWLALNGIYKDNLKVLYRKIKYVKSYGFVDFSFKNTNTLSNKRKEKIKELEKEIKELKQFKKDTFRYWKLLSNQMVNKKLTKQQNEFLDRYCSVINQELNGGTSNGEGQR